MEDCRKQLYIYVKDLEDQNLYDFAEKAYQIRDKKSTPKYSDDLHDQINLLHGLFREMNEMTKEQIEFLSDSDKSDLASRSTQSLRSSVQSSGGDTSPELSFQRPTEQFSV